MMKRIFSVLFATAVMLTSLMSSFSVNAAGTYFLSEGIYYGIKNGEAYIHGFEGDRWDIVIPEKFLDKYNVTEVEEYAFFENSTRKSWTLKRLRIFAGSATRLSRAVPRCARFTSLNLYRSSAQASLTVVHHYLSRGFSRIQPQIFPASAFTAALRL